MSTFAQYKDSIKNLNKGLGIGYNERRLVIAMCKTSLALSADVYNGDCDGVADGICGLAAMLTYYGDEHGIHVFLDQDEAKYTDVPSYMAVMGIQATLKGIVGGRTIRFISLRNLQILSHNIGRNLLDVMDDGEKIVELFESI